MALGAGVKLGHYEITAPLGAGGMGEVYRAHDARLGRDVAVKVLPANFARDEDRLRRFTQEARAVAALNHPNILAIYDVGTQDGVPYLICELLKGESLREKLDAGPLPARRALDYARQVAAGLAAAHDSGVVHRDLKPDNIYITSDNQVKLLDFGLAKLATRSDDDVTRSRHTEIGTVLGTAGYMSPEQVRGQVADHRSDIFSLGVVLYEMLAGQRAFPGESSVEVMNAILKQEPPELRSANPHINALVEHCLQKNPGERFQSARDLAFALAALASPSSQSHVAAPTQSWRRRPAWMYLALGLLLVAAAASYWAFQVARTPQAPPKLVGFDRLTDFVGLETSPSISPDGKSVVFVADAGGKRQLWVQLTAGGTPLQLTRDAADHLDPRWSQDSAAILYYAPPRESDAAGSIWEVAALGGSPRKLADALTEADVSHDGTKLAFFRLANGQTELVVTDRDGSNAHAVTRFGNFAYLHPRWSPDDKWIAYDHPASNWADDIYIVASGGGEPKQVTHEGKLMAGHAWRSDGSAIVYSSARSATTLYLPIMQLYSQPLAGGAPRQLTFGDLSYQNPDVGRDGRVVASRWRMQFDIWKYPVDGKDALENARRGVRITAQTGQVQTPTLSPDESQVAFLSDSGSHGNIWVKDLKTGELRQITHERDPNVVLGVPVWSPDGSQIVIAISRYLDPGTDVGYWSVAPDGSGYHMIMKAGSWATWSPDGKWLYYSLDSPVMPKSQWDIMKVPIAGGEPQRVREDGGMSPMLSPDGKILYWVAPLPLVNGKKDYEIRKAEPEGAASSTLLLRIASERLPTWQGLHPVVSHSGKWLALTLNDEYGTNLWVLNTSDGEAKRVVDFGERRTFIARRVAWSRDDDWIYAAVGEGDADVVSLNGLLQ